MHQLRQMSNMPHDSLKALPMCIRSSILDCSFRRAHGLSSQNVGNILLLYAGTIVCYQVQEMSLLASRRNEYLKHTATDTSADKISSKKNELLDEVY